MNNILRFFLEFIGSFIVIGILEFLIMLLFEKLFNPITAAIFTFILSGLLIFLTAQHFIQAANPAFIFLPILIFYLVVDLIRANRKMNKSE